VITEDVKIINRLGLHARPAAMFVQTATRFESDVFVRKDGSEVNGKSVMGMMMLAAGCGTAITLVVDGPDEKTAMVELKKLFEKKFEEE